MNVHPKFDRELDREEERSVSKEVPASAVTMHGIRVYQFEPQQRVNKTIVIERAPRWCQNL